MLRITRRAILAGATTAAIVPAFRTAVANPLPELVLWGPPAGPSITLAHAIASGALRSVADSVVFKAWRTPDELRAGLTSGTMQAFVLPTQSAAALFNKGLGVRLVNVMTNGLLYLVSADASLTAIGALKGRTVAVPFRNDTTEVLFRRLLTAARLVPDADMTLQFTGTPMEAVQLLMMGRADAALLPEPTATAAILRTAQSDRPVSRVVDIQKAWSDATGLAPVLPQAGLGVTTAFLEANAPAVEALHAALVQATAAVNADPARAAGDAATPLGLPAPVIERAIAHSNLVAVRARDARPALEAVFRAVAEADPKIIGGALPAAGFYL
ncbi:ABC transporter substrate-binding protein [Azospirillum sp.]|uniref:ABC transporter substrate-binding protein n=1 Tax=Azospirillum sp. TaxID=34012 RepID=UPI002D5D7542|nr:PhnD/SsuA/transferrin family substrate-binding protein [Azospirillum sp.]HYD64449.1 PhnD/SsuA/transferrin family substrate-binding protein [Azospirillum sp.]